MYLNGDQIIQMSTSKSNNSSIPQHIWDQFISNENTINIVFKTCKTFYINIKTIVLFWELLKQFKYLKGKKYLNTFEVKHKNL